MADHKKWHILEVPSLIWEVWPDEVVVFNPLSGETHQLNDMAAQVLSWLESSPQTIENLVVSYCDQFGIDESDKDVERLISGLLKEFDDLGLAEPVE